jgi:predicted nucleotidyltransferase
MEDLPLDEIERIATGHGATSVKIFGSRARGDARPDSDLDLLISPGPRMSLFDMIGLEHDLEDLLGIEVDVVSERALHPLLRETILAEARPLDAA